MAAPGDYVAIVTDAPLPAAGVPVIRLDDEAWLDALADLVERTHHESRSGMTGMALITLEEVST
jgi:hypothetical protein